MTEAEQNAVRAAAAAKVVFDGRGTDEIDAILVTTMHTLATILITICNRDPYHASVLLNASIGPGVANLLLAYYEKHTGT